MENDSYAFQYQDNGDGSKKVEEERKQGGGLGLRVVERLTADLGGEWNAKIDQNGFLGGFTFPLVK